MITEKELIDKIYDEEIEYDSDSEYSDSINISSIKRAIQKALRESKHKRME